MTKLRAAASLLLFLAPLANGQNQSAQVAGSVNGIGLCSQKGVSKAFCSANYSSPDGTKTAGVEAGASNDYGFAAAGAGAVVNCSSSCEMGASAQAQADFSDSATLQGVPSSGAYFLIKVGMIGQTDDPSYTYIQTSLELQMKDTVNGSNCVIANKLNGNCFTYIPVNNDETVYFGVTNASAASPNLQVTNGNGTLEAGVSTKGTIIELAVVDQKGQVLKNVIILTGSGHQYPQ
jgi:hypothetical protein